jgi:diguanylate cyclase (GGDEF)-like protein
MKTLNKQRLQNSAARASQRWLDLTDPRSALRLSVLLIIAAAFFVPAAPSGPGVTVAFVIATISLLGTAVLLNHYAHGSRNHVLAAGLAMLVFVVAIAAIASHPLASALILVPVLYAGLTCSGRHLWTLMLVALAAWLCTGVMSQPVPSLSDLPVLIGGFLPVAATALVLRFLGVGSAQARTQLAVLLNSDELTGTMSMRAFTQLMPVVHESAEAAGKGYALLLVDIANLRQTNDRFGREQGDRVIMATADALKRSIRPRDFVARYDGDEFMVYLADADRDLAQVVSNRIAQNIYNITLSFDRSTKRVGVITGAAVYPDDGSSLQELMSAAEKAMHREKEFRRSIRPDDTSADLARRQAGIEEY